MTLYEIVYALRDVPEDDFETKLALVRVLRDTINDLRKAKKPNAKPT